MIQITAESMSVKKVGKPKNDLEHMKVINNNKRGLYQKKIHLLFQFQLVHRLSLRKQYKHIKQRLIQQLYYIQNDYKPFVNGEIGIIPRKLQEVNL